MWSVDFRNVIFFIQGGLPSRFQFAGLHFHWGSESDETVTGSEHTVEGQAYPMELHLVHFNAEYGSNIGKGRVNCHL